MSIKFKRTAQTNRVTVALLTVVMIGFGLFAERHAQTELVDTLHATIHVTTHGTANGTAQASTQATTHAITSPIGH